eukprot:GHVT01086202.1.p2 GENE.GHVT01086202.1~~GHVT01086202.1.p2  ORF type:complete len:217 (+),score=14.76 GHVT01086202.1:187-837(+)
MLRRGCVRFPPGALGLLRLDSRLTCVAIEVERFGVCRLVFRPSFVLLVVCGVSTHDSVRVTARPVLNGGRFSGIALARLCDTTLRNSVLWSVPPPRRPVGFRDFTMPGKICDGSHSCRVEKFERPRGMCDDTRRSTTVGLDSAETQRRSEGWCVVTLRWRFDVVGLLRRQDPVREVERRLVDAGEEQSEAAAGDNPRELKLALRRLLRLRDCKDPK